MTSTGAMAVEPGGRIDIARMHRERFQRVLDAMERHDLDVLLLATGANGRYVTGAQGKVSAPRTFAPGYAPTVIVLKAQREFHFTAPDDEGVPESVPRDHLHPPSYDPSNLVGTVKKVLGSFGTGRVGVDRLSPIFFRLLGEAFPGATLVNGEPAMREARSVKTRDEIDFIRTSIAISESALAEVVSALRPGVTERELLGVFLGKAAEYGAANPAFQGGFCVQPKVRDDPDGASINGPPVRQITSDRPVLLGELVTLSGGAFFRGYESDVGRTWICGERARATSRQKALYERWARVYESMADRCRPGLSVATLRRAYESFYPLPTVPVVHGTGVGYEPPILGADSAGEPESEWLLEPGMVLVLQPYVWEERVGGFWSKETLLVTAEGHERLTAFHPGPAASS